MRIYKHTINYVKGKTPVFYASRPLEKREERLKALHIAFPVDSVWRREAESNIDATYISSIPLIEVD